LHFFQLVDNSVKLHECSPFCEDIFSKLYCSNSSDVYVIKIRHSDG